MNERNLVLYGACGILAVLVGWGFALSGSPSKNRALMEDRNHLAAVDCLACFAQQYACAFEAFPESQQKLVGYMHEHSANNLWCNQSGLNCGYGRVDPHENFNAYRYSASGKDSYSICVALQYPEAEQEIYQAENILPIEMKGYKPGDQCFTFRPHTCPGKAR